MVTMMEQVEGAPVHPYPFSTKHPDEHPSPSDVFPSSQVSPASIFPFEQIKLHVDADPIKFVHSYPVSMAQDPSHPSPPPVF